MRTLAKQPVNFLLSENSLAFFLGLSKSVSKVAQFIFSVFRD